MTMILFRSGPKASCSKHPADLSKGRYFILQLQYRRGSERLLQIEPTAFTRSLLRGANLYWESCGGTGQRACAPHEVSAQYRCSMTAVEYVQANYGIIGWGHHGVARRYCDPEIVLNTEMYYWHTFCCRDTWWIFGCFLAFLSVLSHQWSDEAYWRFFDTLLRKGAIRRPFRFCYCYLTWRSRSTCSSALLSVEVSSRSSLLTI